MPGIRQAVVSLIVMSGLVLSGCSSGERSDGATVTNRGSAVTYPEDPSPLVIGSVGDSIHTIGETGAPSAIVEAAGGRGHVESMEPPHLTDTIGLVGWSGLHADPPDVLVSVDKDEHPFEDKVERLRGPPSTRDLPVVPEERFINLPYAMTMTSALNTGAAEYVRRGTENFGLVPEAAVEDVVRAAGIPCGAGVFPGLDPGPGG